jgi:hypothetical protein
MPKKFVNHQVRRLAKLTFLGIVVYFILGSFLVDPGEHEPSVSSSKKLPVDSDKKEISHTSIIPKTKPQSEKVINKTTTTTKAPFIEEKDAEKSEPAIDPESLKDPKALIDHDYYCDRYGEWLQLTPNCFIKKSFSFYLADKDEYRTFLLIRKNNPVMNIDLVFEIRQNGQLLMSHFHNSTHEERIRSGWFVDEYGHTVMSKKINLRKIISDGLAKNLTFDFDTHKKSLNITVSFIDRSSGNRSVNSVPVVIKSIEKIDKSRQRSALLCSRCFYFKSTDYKKFFWWVELNRLSGYNRIVICNNSIPNTLAFQKIFFKYKDFLFVKQLRCVPNFLDDVKFKSYKYLKS